MNFKKVRKSLKKINNLFETVLDENQINPIERDLLLSYTRNLYEHIMDMDAKDNDQSINKNESSRTSQPIEKNKSIADIAKEEINSDPYKSQHRTVLADINIADEDEPDEKMNVEKKPSPEPKAVLADINIADDEDADVSIGDDFQDLFAEVQTKELSEKLSQSPIADLGKAMSINDRIFTIQELFDGDNDLFNTTISRLNSFDNYNQAKTYLANGIARDKGWNQESKIKKATNFIKLVQRRYA